MIRRAAIACSLLLLVTTVDAQWRTESYALHRGWNGIWLPVDLTGIDIEDVDLPLEITEVWRWDPNDDAATFTEDVNESITLEIVEDWSRWKRSEPLDSDLIWLRGNAAYLVKVDIPQGETLNWSLTGRAVAPAYKWRTDGLNFYGFNTRTGFTQTFNQYFQGTGLVNFGTEIYQYPGNDFDAVQPQILGNPRQQPIRRLRAYWIRSNQYSTYAGPVSVIPGSGEGLLFDDLASTQSLQIRNSSPLSEPATVSLEVIASESYPAYADTPAQLQSGPVKLGLRGFDPSTGAPTVEPISGDRLDLVMESGELRDLIFVVDWDAMAFVPGDRFESLIRVTSDRNMVEYHLPVVAEAPVRTGLWLGEATITHVRNQFYDPNAPDEQENGMFPVRRPASIRLIVHFDDTGTPRLISQAFLGIDTEDAPVLATTETPLDASRLDTAIRLTATHLPPEKAYAGSAVGDEITFPVTIPFDDPHNPFVHQYHPDHDNSASDGTSLSAGVESFDIVRTITLSLQDEPMEGLSIGWGSTIIGGIFAENISGIHRYGIDSEGTFVLRRVSDIPTLNQPSP